MMQGAPATGCTWYKCLGQVPIVVEQGWVEALEAGPCSLMGLQYKRLTPEWFLGLSVLNSMCVAFSLDAETTTHHVKRNL